VRPNIHANARGFTLIEAMVVVAIVGILATLGVYGVRKYILSAKASEAIQMIGSIKAAQESYKSETFSYLDVSGSSSMDDLTKFYPTSTPSNKAHGWGDTSTDQGKAFQTLGVHADAPVYFAYGCAAGDGSNAVPAPGTSMTVDNWPSTSGGAPWYVVRAVGDLDADDVQSVYVSASFTGQIIVDKEGE
jgi:type IV pilus assembly protein PilA